MPHFVGLDVSKATTSICIVDDTGATVIEGVVETLPKAIIGFLRGERRRYARIGIEAMSLAAWLYEQLARAGLPIVCIEARHAHGVLKGRLNKTDRNDARGIAEIMRTGLYKAVHVKTAASQRAKVLLTTRHLLCEKRRDIDNLIRGLLLQFGRKLVAGRPTSFERRTKELATKCPPVQDAVASLLAVRGVIEAQIAALEASISDLVAGDQVCQRLMTAPGVGPLTALSFRAAIDVPERFKHSRDVGVHLGLTPRTYKSGTIERRGRISKCGDKAARSSLFLAAKVVLSRRVRSTSLQIWGRRVAASRGYLRGVIAVARRLAVILHLMWLRGTDYRDESLSS